MNHLSPALALRDIDLHRPHILHCWYEVPSATSIIRLGTLSVLRKLSSSARVSLTMSRQPFLPCRAIVLRRITCAIMLRARAVKSSTFCISGLLVRGCRNRTIRQAAKCPNHDIFILSQIDTNHGRAFSPCARRDGGRAPITPPNARASSLAGGVSPHASGPFSSASPRSTASAGDNGAGRGLSSAPPRSRRPSGSFGCWAAIEINRLRSAGRHCKNCFAAIGQAVAA